MLTKGMNGNAHGDTPKSTGWDWALDTLRRQQQQTERAIFAIRDLQQAVGNTDFVLDAHMEGGTLKVTVYGGMAMARNLANAIRTASGVPSMAKSITQWGPDYPVTVYHIAVNGRYGVDTILVCGAGIPETCRIEYVEETIKRAVVHCSPEEA